MVRSLPGIPGGPVDLRGKAAETVGGADDATAGEDRAIRGYSFR